MFENSSEANRIVHVDSWKGRALEHYRGLKNLRTKKNKIIIQSGYKQHHKSHVCLSLSFEEVIRYLEQKMEKMG